MVVAAQQRRRSMLFICLSRCGWEADKFTTNFFFLNDRQEHIHTFDYSKKCALLFSPPQLLVEVIRDTTSSGIDRSIDRTNERTIIRRTPALDPTMLAAFTDIVVVTITIIDVGWLFELLLLKLRRRADNIITFIHLDVVVSQSLRQGAIACIPINCGRGNWSNITNIMFWNDFRLYGLHRKTLLLWHTITIDGISGLRILFFVTSTTATASNPPTITNQTKYVICMVDRLGNDDRGPLYFPSEWRQV